MFHACFMLIHRLNSYTNKSVTYKLYHHYSVLYVIDYIISCCILMYKDLLKIYIITLVHSLYWYTKIYKNIIKQNVLYLHKDLLLFEFYFTNITNVTYYTTFESTTLIISSTFCTTLFVIFQICLIVSTRLLPNVTQMSLLYF